MTQISQGKKPYYSLNDYLKERFGQKVYKLALDGGMTCPNRDGTLGTGGCIFCSGGGSGDFAAPRSLSDGSVLRQIEAAKSIVAKKITSGKYIAYFQSYTNTYAPADQLNRLFSEAISCPDIVALSVATRPDCLPPEVVALLARLNAVKPVWVELGLQTIHPATASLIRRGYDLPCYEDAFIRLKNAGLQVITHVILGLPGESRGDMLATVDYLGQSGIDGIKLQLLHVLKGTDLAAMYAASPFPIFTMEEYVNLVCDCIALLPPSVVIHRITGDGPKRLLLAPAWSADKKRVLGTFSKIMAERGIYQGMSFVPHRGVTLPSASTDTPKDISSISEKQF